MLHSSKCTFFPICDASAAVSSHCCSSACLEHPSWHTQSQVRQKTGRKTLSSCNWKEARRTSQHLVTKLGRFSVECHETKTKVITLANPKGHRKSKENRCSCREARENARMRMSANCGARFLSQSRTADKQSKYFSTLKCKPPYNIS